MKNIIVIAKNTFKETIRDRILFGIIAFALVYLFFTIFLGSISLGENEKIINNLGLAGIYLFGMIITIFLGTAILYKEIEKKTLYFILPKPVSHFELVLGKFAGLMASIALTIILMGLIFGLIVYFKTSRLNPNVITALVLQIFEMGLFVALTILFSTFSRPLASTIYAVLVLYIGHSLNLIVEVAEKTSLVLGKIALLIYYLFPNLEKFNIRNLAAYDTDISSLGIFWSIAYAIAYSSLLLYLAVILLKRKEL